MLKKTVAARTHEKNLTVLEHTMYSGSMNGSLIATTSNPHSSAFRRTRRPMRPNLTSFTKNFLHYHCCPYQTTKVIPKIYKNALYSTLSCMSNVQRQEYSALAPWCAVVMILYCWNSEDVCFQNMTHVCTIVHAKSIHIYDFFIISIPKFCINQMWINYKCTHKSLNKISTQFGKPYPLMPIFGPIFSQSLYCSTKHTQCI